MQMNPLEKIYDVLIKRGEQILHNNRLAKKVIDLASNVVGDSSEIFYSVQDKFMATIRMVKAYINKEYTDIPTKTIIIAMAGILYVANPIDLIPNFIPVIGLLDDLSVVVYVLSLINSEVDKFTEWEANAKKG